MERWPNRHSVRGSDTVVAHGRGCCRLSLKEDGLPNGSRTRAFSLPGCVLRVWSGREAESLLPPEFVGGGTPEVTRGEFHGLRSSYCQNAEENVMYQTVRFRFLLLGSAVLLLGCQQPATVGSGSTETASTLQKIIDRGEMRVGYLPWNPTVIKNPRNPATLSGVFPDMINEIAKALGVKATWHETTLSNFTAGLNANQFDFSVGPTFVTIPRAASVAFTIPVAYVGNGGVVRADSSFKPRAIEELKKPGLRIAVLQGQALEEYCRRHLPSANLLVISGGDLTAPLTAVSAGRADIGLMNIVTVASYAAEHSEVVPVLMGQEQIEVLPLAWSVRYTDHDLLGFLNSAITYMKSSGRLERFQAAYPIKLLYDTPALHEATLE